MRYSILIPLLILSINLNAQNIDSTDFVGRRNIVKLNVPALAFKTINVQYERKVADQTAANIGIIKRFNSPIFNYLDRRDDSPLLNIELSSFAVTPEVKFYFRDEIFKGLYLGPFVRWRKDDLRFQYSLLEGKANVRLTDKVLHAGILLGYQLKITKDIHADFWLLGGGLRYSQIEGDGNLELDPTNSYIYSNMFSTMNGIFNKEFTYTINGQNFKYSGESYRASFRGVGICLGIRF